jgi:hypothetical protein
MKRLPVCCAVLLALSAPVLSAPLSERDSSVMEPEDPLAERPVRKAEPANTEEGAKQQPAAKPAGKPEDGVIRVPYIPQSVKDELREELRKELREQLVDDVTRKARKERWGVADAWPEWVHKLKFSGDFRLRGQIDDFAAHNTPIGEHYIDVQKTNEKRTEVFLNTTEDRERLRARARFGVEAKPGLLPEGWDVAMRLATGSAGDPVSTNQTLGTSSGNYALFLDRAFVRYRSFSTATTFWGGRMPNPFFSTDLVWDEDLAFDGLALKFEPRIETAADSPDFNPYVTFGAFPLQEIELSQQDKWLYGAQLGFNARLGGNHRLAFGVAYYDYSNIEGELNELNSSLLDHTAPKFVQKGNTMFRIDNTVAGTTPLYGLASDFNELNVTLSLANLSFAPTQVILTADWVENLGFDREEVLARTGGAVYPAPLDESTRGYQVKLTVGRPLVERKGEWQVYGAWKHLGANAVLDAFTDSDFHLGGTDAEGWIAGGSYGLAENVWLSFRYLTSDAIEGPPLGIDTIQLDLNARF